MTVGVMKQGGNMANCKMCNAEIRGKINSTAVQGICSSCLQAYFKGGFKEQPIGDAIPIKFKEAKKGKGFAKNAGVDKKQAKNLSVTVKLNRELYDKLLKKMEKTVKPMSAYIRDIIEVHVKELDKK